MSQTVGREDDDGFTFIWSVENVRSCLVKINPVLTSPMFFVEALESTYWCLSLYPRGVNIFVRLKRAKSGPKLIVIDFEVSGFCVNGSPLVYSSNGDFFNREIDFKHNTELLIGKYVPSISILGETRNVFIPNEVLTIRCQMWKSGAGKSGTGHCYARTRIGTERRTSIWAIEQFSDIILLRQQRTVRVEFQSEKYPPLDIKLTMDECRYCHGQDRSSDDKVKIDILNGSFKQSILCGCKLTTLDSKGRVIQSAEAEQILSKDPWCFPDFISTKELKENKKLCLPRDVLFLRYELVISIGDIVEEIEYSRPTLNALNQKLCFTPVQVTACPSALKGDLDCLLKNELLSDFKFRVGEETIPVHKAILAARSPVFKAMFTNDMKEVRSGCIDIDDLDVDTMRQMLAFVYTDTVKDMQWESASNLYSVSDKYDISPLKHICSSYLTSHLSPSNVCEVLTLADLHNDEELKKIVQEYILNRDRHIFSSEMWKVFMVNNVQLAAATMQLKYTKG